MPKGKTNNLNEIINEEENKDLENINKEELTKEQANKLNAKIRIALQLRSIRKSITDEQILETQKLINRPFEKLDFSKEISDKDIKYLARIGNAKFNLERKILFSVPSYKDPQEIYQMIDEVGDDPDKINDKAQELQVELEAKGIDTNREISIKSLYEKNNPNEIIKEEKK